MRTVPAVKVVTSEDAVEEPLPPRVQEALGQLVGAAKEGLLALSVGVGLGVLSELMEEEVVRHEALSDRARCETSPVGCRSSPSKLRAA
jgi:putative transposase